MRNFINSQKSTLAFVLIFAIAIAIVTSQLVAFANNAEQNRLEKIYIDGVTQTAFNMVNNFDGELQEGTKITCLFWEIVVDRIVDGEWAVLEVFNKVENDITMVDYKLN